MARRADARSRLIVALDSLTLREALACARHVRGLARAVKVGSILFTACGPEAIRRLRALGFDVMLDLKFLDIPSTVELSCWAAVQHRVAMATVHASGELAMLEAAVRGMREAAKQAHVTRPLVLGVTVLTSIGTADPAAAAARVLALARRASQAGCDGVVASAHEVPALRRAFGTRLKIVCPGIRPRDAQQGDQQRVATPGDALAAGADALVIGRPITSARFPRRTAQRILEEMEAVTW